MEIPLTRCRFKELEQPRRNEWYNTASPEQFMHKEDKTKEKSGNGRERKFILQILGSVVNLFFKVCFQNW